MDFEYQDDEHGISTEMYIDRLDHTTVRVTTKQRRTNYVGTTLVYLPQAYVEKIIEVLTDEQDLQQWTEGDAAISQANARRAVELLRRIKKSEALLEASDTLLTQASNEGRRKSERLRQEADDVEKIKHDLGQFLNNLDADKSEHDKPTEDIGHG